MDGLPDSFKPLKGHVLIKRDNPDAEKGGIIIPEVWRIRGCRATVVDVGDDVETVKSSDNILFQKEYTVLPFNERDMAITEADRILAKIELDGNIERIMPLGQWVLIHQDEETNNSIGGVSMSDKTTNETAWGIVIRIGDKCKDVQPKIRVYFETQKNIVVIENDRPFRLIKEGDILCIKNN